MDSFRTEFREAGIKFFASVTKLYYTAEEILSADCPSRLTLDAVNALAEQIENVNRDGIAAHGTMKTLDLFIERLSGIRVSNSSADPADAVAWEEARQRLNAAIVGIHDKDIVTSNQMLGNQALVDAATDVLNAWRCLDSETRKRIGQWVVDWVEDFDRVGPTMTEPDVIDRKFKGAEELREMASYPWFAKVNEDDDDEARDNVCEFRRSFFNALAIAAWNASDAIQEKKAESWRTLFLGKELLLGEIGRLCEHLNPDWERDLVAHKDALTFIQDGIDCYQLRQSLGDEMIWVGGKNHKNAS